MTGKKPSVIIGINPTHNASAAIMVDGTIIAAASEERFSRVKNHIGIPVRAIEFCLKEARVSAGDLTGVVIAGKDESPFYISTLRDAKLNTSKGIITIDSSFRFLRYE